MRPLLSPCGGYSALQASFRWAIPARLNMARQACFDWEGQPDRVAIRDLGVAGVGAGDVSYG